MRKKITDQEVEFLDHSNRIEGVYDGDSLAQAIEAWEFLKSKKRLTIGVVLKTHKILMLNQNLAPDEKGYFRKVPVWIGGREGILHDRIKYVIEEWLGRINGTAIIGEDSYIQSRIKAEHVEYERIHPFVDGNGRTGRMFMNWQRLKLGLPILVIHEGKEQQIYYEWFK